MVNRLYDFSIIEPARPVVSVASSKLMRWPRISNIAPPIGYNTGMKWPQFSLRTLFVLVTILGIVCGWFAFKVNEARHQKRVVEQIWDMGATVSYVCDLVPSHGLEKWMIAKFGKDFLSNAWKVSATRTFDDSQFERLIPLLKELPALEELNLSLSQISDKHLKELVHLHSLKALHLDFTLVTKDAVEELRSEMPKTTITWSRDN